MKFDAWFSLLRVGATSFFLFHLQSEVLAAPSWFTSGVKFNTSTLTVSCTGSGPDISVARQQALNQCRSIASEHLKGYSFKSQSLAVEDNESASLHSEVSSNVQVVGLGPCDSIHETTEGSESDGYKVYIECRFNTAKAKVIAATEEKPTQSEELKAENSAKNINSDFMPATKDISVQKDIESENHHLLLTTVPMAKSVIIRGARPRTVRIDSNPKMILIYKDDQELIVRGPNGTAPKHILLNSEVRRTSASGAYELEVFLDGR